MTSTTDNRRRSRVPDSSPPDTGLREKVARIIDECILAEIDDGCDDAPGNGALVITLTGADEATDAILSLPELNRLYELEAEVERLQRGVDQTWAQYVDADQARIEAESRAQSLQAALEPFANSKALVLFPDAKDGAAVRGFDAGLTFVDLRRARSALAHTQKEDGRG